MRSPFSPGLHQPEPAFANGRLQWRARWLLFLTIWMFCIAISGGDLGADASGRLQVAHSFWTSAPQVTADDAGLGARLIGRNGSVNARWLPGQSIVMLPADMLATAATHSIRSPFLRERSRAGMVALLVFPLLCAAAVLVAFELLLALGFTQAEAMLGSVA